jgi:hypothetical protein
MYVNGKMISVETDPGIRAGGMKENDGGGEFKFKIFATLFKNFCKCLNLPQPSTTIKKDSVVK